MKTITAFLLFFTLLIGSTRAAIVDTVRIEASAMKRTVKAITAIPQGKQHTPCPVLYLLHGYAGSGQEWYDFMDVAGIADRYGMLVVCPDGENSWYWDSPLDPSSQYETFISKDLVSYIDSHFKTIRSPQARAITGYSMGGHGALWNAIRHKDVFGNAGSMSGGVDIRPFPEKWEMKKQLGPLEQNRLRWDRYTVVNQLDGLKDGELNLIIDCGYQDFFLSVNNNLHDSLLKRGIGHTYILSPGRHDWNYWRKAIEYQCLFFQHCFKKAQ